MMVAMKCLSCLSFAMWQSIGSQASRIAEHLSPFWRDFQALQFKIEASDMLKAPRLETL